MSTRPSPPPPQRRRHERASTGRHEMSEPLRAMTSMASLVATLVERVPPLLLTTETTPIARDTCPQRPARGTRPGRPYRVLVMNTGREVAYHSKVEAEAGDEEAEGPPRFSGNRSFYKDRDWEHEGERLARQREDVPYRPSPRTRRGLCGPVPALTGMACNTHRA